jgi:hypothetical protein
MPFCWTADSAGELVEIGDGHRVRIQPGDNHERMIA